MPTQKRPVRLTTEQTTAIAQACGLSGVHARRLLKANKRPTNPLTAAAWDDVIEELGLGKAAAK